MSIVYFPKVLLSIFLSPVEAFIKFLLGIAQTYLQNKLCTKFCQYTLKRHKIVSIKKVTVRTFIRKLLLFCWAISKKHFHSYCLRALWQPPDRIIIRFNRINSTINYDKTILRLPWLPYLVSPMPNIPQHGSFNHHSISLLLH